VKTLGKVVMVPTIASGLVAAGAGIANAYSYTKVNINGYYNGSDVFQRSGPGTGYKALWQTGAEGQRAHVTRYTCDGQAHSGDPCWSYATDLATGHTGWTWSPYITWTTIISS